MRGRQLLLAVLPSLLAASSAASAAPEAKKKVVVLELANSVGLTDEEASYLTELVRGEARKALPDDGFQVYTRENIQEYLPPGTTLAECESGECEVEIGRKVGADLVITGDVVLYAGELRVPLKMHETRSGVLIAQEAASAMALKGLEEPVRQAAHRLLAKVAGSASPDAKVVVKSVADPADDGSGIKNPPADDKGYLIIESSPKGARVRINGEDRGVTPLQLELMAGEYVVVCKPANNLYAPASKRIELTRERQKVTMELPPTFGVLRVDSEPKGAEIAIGGESTGQVTPYEFREKPGGRYPITLTKPLHRSASRTVELGGGKRTEVKLSLQPDFGVLEVKSEPPGAEILIDGEPTHAKTPHTFAAKPTGTTRSPSISRPCTCRRRGACTSAEARRRGSSSRSTPTSGASRSRRTRPERRSCSTETTRANRPPRRWRGSRRARTRSGSSPPRTPRGCGA